MSVQRAVLGADWSLTIPNTPSRMGADIGGEDVACFNDLQRIWRPPIEVLMIEAIHVTLTEVNLEKLSLSLSDRLGNISRDVRDSAVAVAVGLLLKAKLELGSAYVKVATASLLTPAQSRTNTQQLPIASSHFDDGRIRILHPLTRPLILRDYEHGESDT